MTNDIKSIPLDEAINNARYVAEEVGELSLHQSDCIHRVVGEVFKLGDENLALKKENEKLAATIATFAEQRQQLVKELTFANTDGFGKPMNARITSIIERLKNQGVTKS